VFADADLHDDSVMQLVRKMNPMNRHARRCVNALTKRNADDAVTASACQDLIIREPECRRIIDLSRSTRWRMERAGQFPKRRRISPGCTGWPRSEISIWIGER
jgi:prophage regulatory protein